jgi:hypothetical protein
MMLHPQKLGLLSAAASRVAILGLRNFRRGGTEGNKQRIQANRSRALKPIPAAVLDQRRRLIDRNDLEAVVDLGATSLLSGDFICAADCYRYVLSRRPDSAEDHCLLGNALFFQGQIDEGIQCFLRALVLDPDHIEAHLGLAFAYLLRGDLPQGWHHYQWRLRRFHPTRPLSAPQWHGQALNGKSILLRAEQGLGDTLQFVRYLPLVAARGGQVILEAQPGLCRLLAGMDGARVISQNEACEGISYQCPLLSLPWIFATELATIPAKIPYLKVPTEDVCLRRGLRGRHDLRVGLIWAGSRQHVRDRERSITLGMLAALADLKNVAFFALQKGPSSAQLQSTSPGFKLSNLESPAGNIFDTARALMSLDLVITVDTSVAHLAGALGKPVWILLPFIPDWRWLLDREDSPWYPTARLFRQTAPGAWGPVIAKVRNELNELALGSAMLG